MAARKELDSKCQFMDISEDSCFLCGSLVRTPTLTSCCGNTYCHGCISPYQQGRQPCPTCEKKDFSILAQRMSLKALGVPCSMMNRGCNWMGSPDQLEAHLDPILDNCQYIDTKCPQNCQKMVPRNELMQHMKKECAKRMFTCRYCPFSGTYEEVSTLHMSECRYAPIPSPSVCETMFYVPPAGTNIDESILTKKISEHFDEIQKTVRELRQEDSENFLVLKSSFTDEEPDSDDLKGERVESGQVEKEVHKEPDSVQEGKDYTEEKSAPKSNPVKLEEKDAKEESTQTKGDKSKEEIIAQMAKKLEKTMKINVKTVKTKMLDGYTEMKPEKERAKPEESKKFVEQKDLEEVETKLRVELHTEYETLAKEHEMKIREVERQIEEHKEKIESQRRSIGTTEKRIMEHLSQLEEPSNKLEADTREKLADKELLERLKRSLEEQDKKISEQEKKIAQHGTKIDKQNKTLKRLRTTSLSIGSMLDKEPQGKALEKQMESLEKELIDSFKELERRCSEVSVPTGLVTSTDLSNIALGMRRDFEMKNYMGTQAYTSPTMYTHLCGYKFCIGVGSFLTGDLFAEVVVTPGEFDEQLKWPVAAEFTLKLINRHGGEDISCTSPVYSWVRPKVTNVRLGYIGRVNPNTFLQHWELKDYLKEDTLHFVVVKVQLL